MNNNVSNNLENLSVKQLMDHVNSSKIVYGNILALKFMSETNVDLNAIRKYLFKDKFTPQFSSKYVRNSEGQLFKEKTPTKNAMVHHSNGTKEMIELINFATNNPSAMLFSLLNDEVVETLTGAYNNNEKYLDETANTYKVMDTNMDRILSVYMAKMPRDRIQKDTLLNFLSTYRELGDLSHSGYDAVNFLIDHFANAFTKGDIEKISTYISSRLGHIEDKFEEFKDVTRKAEAYMQKIVNRSVTPSRAELEKHLKNLNNESSTTYRQFLDKYNDELRKYKELLRPYHIKFATDGLQNKTYRKINELYKEVKVTKEIINSKYVQYPAINDSVRKQITDYVKRNYKDVDSALIK